MTRKLYAEPLTADAFAPFGTVIERAGAEHFPINGGTTERYHRLAVADTRAAPDESPQQGSAETIISLFVGQPYELPAKLWALERHPLGSQAFVPLQDRPWLVVVAPAEDAPAPERLQAFLARGDQGVNYAAGVWHHPLLALGVESRFLVVDREGPGNNCDEWPLAENIVAVTEEDSGP